jgi:hypothetical protein
MLREELADAGKSTLFIEHKNVSNTILTFSSTPGCVY